MIGKLELYKYYKQATIGDCNTPKPGYFDFVGKAKWDAWKSVADLPKEKAMELCKYCSWITVKFLNLQVLRNRRLISRFFRTVD